jgi:hypothetical protein
MSDIGQTPTISGIKVKSIYRPEHPEYLELLGDVVIEGRCSLSGSARRFDEA